MPKTIDLPGFIEPGCLYLASEAKGRLKMGTWAWRQLRRQGLRTIQVGTRSYVFGDDIIEHFRQRAQGPTS
jgi:hypothetical protein